MLGLGLGLTSVRRVVGQGVLLGPGYLSPQVAFSRPSGATLLDASGALVTVGNDVPRYSYDPATGLGGWLIEGASTNVLLNSNDPTAAWWSSSGLTVGAPGGGLSLRPLIEDTTNGAHYLYRQGVPVNAGEVWSTSFLVRDRPGSLKRYVSCYMGGGGGSGPYPATVGAVFDPGAAAVTYLSSGCAAAIVPFGDARLCSFTPPAVAETGSANTRPVRIVDGTSSLTANYAGDGTSGLDVGHLQMELGPLTSSRIITGGAGPVTRVADAMSITGSAFTRLFGAGAPRGYVIVDVLMPLAVAQQRVLVQLDPGGDSNRLQLRTNNAGTQIVGLQYAGTSSGTTASAGAALYGSRLRCGLRWGDGQIGVCMNGAPPASVAATLPSFTTLRFGNQSTGVAPLQGYLIQAVAMADLPDDPLFRSLCSPGYPL